MMQHILLANNTREDELDPMAMFPVSVFMRQRYSTQLKVVLFALVIGLRILG